MIFDDVVGLCAMWTLLEREGATLDKCHAKNPTGTLRAVRKACVGDLQYVRERNTGREALRIYIRALESLIKGAGEAGGEVGQVLRRTLRQFEEMWKDYEHLPELDVA